MLKLRLRQRLRMSLGLMKWYGQREEDKFIAEYFGDFKGNLLSIGENDGITYSNVLYFIKRGWKADLIEPSPRAYRKLVYRHADNLNVQCHQLAIGNKTERLPFYESGSMVNLGDVALASSLDGNLIKQWTKTKFKETYVRVLDWNNFFQYRAKCDHYDLISIDAEGYDVPILEQMDLDKLGCKCIVIEHAGDVRQMWIKLISRLFRILTVTEENIIAVKT